MWRLLRTVFLTVLLLAGQVEMARVHPKPPFTAKEKKVMLNKWIKVRAKHYRLNLKLVHRLIKNESGWDEKAESPTHALGLTQVLLSTGREVLNDPNLTREELIDPITNIEAGLKYLAQMRARYNGNMYLAVTAYNIGFGTVDLLLDCGFVPVNGYAARVVGV